MESVKSTFVNHDALDIKENQQNSTIKKSPKRNEYSSLSGDLHDSILL